MAKEKVKRSDLEEETHIAYFEVIGLVSIAFAVITWEELGYLGQLIRRCLEITVGNWNWIIIIFLFIFGIRAFFFHKLFPMRDVRFYGFAMLLASLLLLSHSTMYEYSLRENSNAIAGAWNIYMEYANSPNKEQDLGGGLLGGIIYQILIFLLGTVGTVLVAILMLILALIFISNNNLETIYHWTKKTMRQVYLLFMRVIDYFKEGKAPRKKHQKTSHKRYGLNVLADSTETVNIAIQKKIANDVRKAMGMVIKGMGVSLGNIDCQIGYSATRLTHSLIPNIDGQNFLRELKKRVDIKGIVRTNDSLVLEFNNRFRELLTLKRLLLMGACLPLGLEINGEVLDFDFDNHRHLLISGANDSGIKTFIKGFIASTNINNQNVGYAIYDEWHDFIELKAFNYLFFGYQDHDIESIIDKLAHEIERRLEILQYLGVNTFLEMNKEIKIKSPEVNPLPRIIFIINGLERSLKEKAGIESKLIYIAQMSMQVGISLVIITRTSHIISHHLRCLIPLKMVFKVMDISQSIELLDTDDGIHIERKGEFILRLDNQIKRGQTGFIAHQEYIKIVSQ